MTGELHQISLEIGRLQQHAEEARASSEAIWRELKGINEKLAPLSGLVKRVETVEAEVDNQKGTRNRVIGAAGVIGTAFGALGGVVAAKLGIKL